MTERPAAPAVGVVVPARNEACRVGAAIAAIVEAAASADRRCDIVVVDDGSRDGTVAAARKALTGHRGGSAVVSVQVGQAARARSRGVEVCRRGLGEPRHAWILSTDADSIVPPDWIERYLVHAADGAVAVAGVVSLIDDEDGRRILRPWQRDYGATLAADGTHPHVHAANLGVRLDAYDAVGGFRDVDRIEDIDLWRRLRAAGYEPVADSRLVVATSGRLEGRVRAGFAAALCERYGSEVVPSAGGQRDPQRLENLRQPPLNLALRHPVPASDLPLGQPVLVDLDDQAAIEVREVGDRTPDDEPVLEPNSIAVGGGPVERHESGGVAGGVGE